jgi:hypothetical protein
MKEKCEHCGDDGFIFLPYQGHHFCKKCFSRLIERRIRHNFRNKGIIDGKPMHLYDDGSAAFGTSKFALQNISKQMPKLEVRFSKQGGKGFKRIICRSLEQECIDYLKSIFSGKGYRNLPNPACNIPQKELEKFCDIHNIKYEKNKYNLQDIDILLMMDNVMKVRPGAMFSLQRISERLP